MKHGKLITLEGSEGAGKSTALKFIQDYLLAHHLEVVVTREPGGTPIAEAIRQLLLHGNQSEVMCSDAELLLMFAARAQHIQSCILPALASGKWVVSDRYVDASYAYQGGGRGLDLHKIETLDKLVVGNYYPQLTLLLDVPADLGVTRTLKRNTAKDRIEQEKIDFFIRVRDAYLARAKADPARIKVIDASLDIADVQAQIHALLDDFIARAVA